LQNERKEKTDQSSTEPCDDNMHHDQAWSALALVSNIRTLVDESLQNLVNVTLVVTSSPPATFSICA
jgi:hypothetical protein